jgi:pilus assembly protein CpaB
MSTKGVLSMRRGSSSLLIIVGVFALLLAAAGAYVYVFSPELLQSSAAAQVAPTPEPDVAVVQAAIDIEANTLISDPVELLKIGMIPASQFNASPQLYFTNPDEVRNLKTLGRVVGNEPVRRDMVGPAGLSLKMPTPVPGQPSIKAFPIQVNALTGVADMIQAGDHVDVMASFNLDVTTFRPGVPENREEGTVQQMLVEQSGNEGSVKVLLQNVQVLDIVRPTLIQPAVEGEATPPPPPPPDNAVQPQQVAPNQSGSTLQNGNWVLVIGVTNQEAEVLRFALDRGIGISTLLRSAGDQTTERTVGSTLRILIDNFGMPVPSGMPPVQQAGPVQIPNVPALPQAKPEVYAPVVTPGVDD